MEGELRELADPSQFVAGKPHELVEVWKHLFSREGSCWGTAP